MKSFSPILYIVIIMTAFLYAEDHHGEPKNSIIVKIIETKVEEGKVNVELKLSNASKEKINLWSFSSDPGKCSIVFYFLDPSGARIPVVRRLVSDATGVSFSVESLAPGESIKISHDLLDGSWVLPEYVGSGEASSLVAELNLPGGIQRAGIWSGRSISEVHELKQPIFRIFPYLAAPHRE
ncbi:MAG: hypothetical protein MUF31_14180 [Akkermansiaceae bacterium]|jgi:hypothetical protein|nr:hypothetical protein [Akkermansiaceae bacterium]